MNRFGFQWHLTDRCNRRCRHCYQDDFSNASERPPEDLQAMADRIFTDLPETLIGVNLTGGEPLLLPHLADLILHLHRYDNLERADIITNGSMIDDRLLERLASLPRFGLFKVSIESGVDAVNDAVRGRGGLDLVARNLPLLKAATGRPAVLMMTLGRHNAGTIRQTVTFARDIGAAGVIFERFVPLGAGLAMADRTLDCGGWLAATGAILSEAGIEADPADLPAYRAYWLDLDLNLGPEQRLTGALCNLGPGSMALMPDGTVHPCRRLPLPLGRLPEQPFAEIAGRLARFAPGATTARLSGPFCGSCGVDDCAGCRALARAASGDWLADDPQCTLRCVFQSEEEEWLR